MEHAGEPAQSAAIVAGLLLVLFIVVPSGLLAAYIAAVRYTRAGSHWSRWRSASFAAGAVLLMIAGLPAVTAWAHHDPRGHMVQHLLLGMFAPLGLVLGAPGTLLLRAVRTEAARRVVALLGKAPVRVLIHPVTALALDIGGMYVLYLTPLFALSHDSPAVHVLVHVHFAVSGYLFTWAIAGPDPAPHRPGRPTRLVVLFVATAAHASLGKIMYGYGFPRGTPFGVEELRAAAELMYYGGDLAELLLTAAFFAAWYRSRSERGRSTPARSAAPSRGLAGAGTEHGLRM